MSIDSYMYPRFKVLLYNNLDLESNMRSGVLFILAVIVTFNLNNATGYMEKSVDYL